jgi:hypothetical protein
MYEPAHPHKIGSIRCHKYTHLRATRSYLAVTASTVMCVTALAAAVHTDAASLTVAPGAQDAAALLLLLLAGLPLLPRPALLPPLL